jgi:hypothetical protein
MARMPPSRRTPRYKSSIDPTVMDKVSRSSSTSSQDPVDGNQTSKPVSTPSDSAGVLNLSKKQSAAVDKDTMAVENGRLYDMSLWRAVVLTELPRYVRAISYLSVGCKCGNFQTEVCRYDQNMLATRHPAAYPTTLASASISPSPEDRI